MQNTCVSQCYGYQGHINEGYRDLYRDCLVAPTKVLTLGQCPLSLLGAKSRDSGTGPSARDPQRGTLRVLGPLERGPDGFIGFCRGYCDISGAIYGM